MSEMKGIKIYQKEFTITEMKELSNGDLWIRGPVMEIGKVLANKTRYDLDIWKDAIKGYQPYLVKRMAYGMMDHPERRGPKGKEVDLGTKLERSYGICVDLEISEDNQMVIGTFEIYRDEANLVGRKLASLLKRGTVGVSIRGTGPTKKLPDGVIKVLRLDLIGIDFVARPSDHPALFNLQESELMEDEEYESDSLIDLSDSEINFEDFFIMEEEGVTRLMCGTNGCKSEMKEESEMEKNLTESVMEMALPKKDITVDMSIDELKNLGADKLAEYVKKLQLKEKAQNYAKLPNGELLKNIFLDLIEKGIGVKTTDSIMILVNEYISKINGSSNEEIVKLKQELVALRSEMANQIATERQKAQSEIDRIKQQADSSIIAAGEDAKIKLNALKQNVAEAQQNSMIVAKEEVNKLRNKLDTTIKTNEKIAEQYYNLLEEKNSDIIELEGELEEMKLTQASTSKEIAQLTENTEVVSRLATKLLEEKESAIDNLVTTEAKLADHEMNLGLLEEKITEFKSLNERLIKERDILVSIKDENQIILENFETNIVRLESEKKENDILISGLMKNSKDIQESMVENNMLLESIGGYVSDIEEENVKKEELLMESDSIIKNISSKVDELTANNKKITEEKEVIEKLALDLSGTLENVNEKVELIIDEKERIKKNNERLVEIERAMKDKIILTESLNNNLRIENSELSNRLTQMRNKLSEIDMKNKKLSKRLKTKKKKLSEKKENLNNKRKVSEASLLESKSSINDLLNEFGYADESIDDAFQAFEDEDGFMVEDNDTKIFKKSNPLKGLLGKK